MWIEETVVYFLTMRINCGSVVDLLETWGYLNHGIDLTEIDRMTAQVAEGKQSRRVFNNSVRMIKKNQGLPISNRWLDT